MSGTTGQTGGQMNVLQRVMAEHRRIVILLLAVLALDLIVYVAIVRPLAQRVATVAEREAAGARALAAARAEQAAASGTLTGKDRAQTALATFYTDVLPADVSGARRLTHVRLQQLAREAGLRFERAANETIETRDSRLTRLKIEMALSGPWSSVRAFIHALETAPEFVVIDNVELSEATAGELTVNVAFSTYFRTPPS